MLNELDKELESRGLYFVWYADDSIIFVKSENGSASSFTVRNGLYRKKLGLIDNAEKSKMSRPNGKNF